MYIHIQRELHCATWDCHVKGQARLFTSSHGLSGVTFSCQGRFLHISLWPDTLQVEPSLGTLGVRFPGAGSKLGGFLQTSTQNHQRGRFLFTKIYTFQVRWILNRSAFQGLDEPLSVRASKRSLQMAPKNCAQSAPVGTTYGKRPGKWTRLERV